ncbi:type I secretion system permease/ATPase [Vibrio intestinalis]|uniref:type I secretion system permease/ATPase n=1 Tax=Vibrio intestinalis TaxID=2933291 RepID=UPI0021A4BAC8|nr:ATP-binding cassette domain-containing protein [Vibrio intestinalis]
MNNAQLNWPELSPFRREIILVLLGLGLFLNLLILAIPIYSLQVFDRVLTSRSLDTLLLISLIVLFLLTIQAILEVLKNKYLQHNAIKLDALASSTLFTLMASHPQGNKTNLHDIKELKTFLQSPAFTVMFDIIWIPLFLVVMFILHPIVGSVGLIAVLAVSGFSTFSHYSKKQQFTDSQTASYAALQAQNEALSQQNNIQTQHLSQGLTAQYQHLTAERIWHESQLNQRANLLSSSAKYLRFVLQMLIMATGAILVINNSMSAGGIIAGSILMSRALQPLEQLASALPAWQSSFQANQRITAFFNEKLHQESTTQFSDVKGRLHIDGVSWSAEKQQRPYLNNIRLRLEPGNRVLISGPSGSGKSLLCQLLVGSITPSHGRVNIDGASLPQWSSAQLQHVVGYVPQHIQFVTGTIKQNIAHFCPDIDDQQVISAANQIAIHQEILKLPKGYNTIIGDKVGDKGYPIPTGLMQGIAIARALYFKPKLLVLDEANAHLDSHKLAAFARLLDELATQKCGVVLVSHDQSLAKHTDWLVELNNGEITSAQPVAKDSKVQPLKKAASNG